MAQQENREMILPANGQDWTIKDLMENMKQYWEKIDFDYSIVFRKIWKEKTETVLLIHQVIMLMGELGEILRTCYLEPETDRMGRVKNTNSDDGKDASNVLLHALQIIRILEGDKGVNSAIYRALREMKSLSKKYAKKYGVIL